MNRSFIDPLDWVRAQGVVAVRSEDHCPNFAERIAGEPIRGSWWGQPRSHEIFAALTRVLGSGGVVATRVVDGKVTLLHRRVWPAVVREVRFPDWFPPEDIATAALLTVDEALALLPACLD